MGLDIKIIVVNKINEDLFARGENEFQDVEDDITFFQNFRSNSCKNKSNLLLV